MTNNEIAERLRKEISKLHIESDKIEVIWTVPIFFVEKYLEDLILELEGKKSGASENKPDIKDDPKNNIIFENRTPILIPKPKGWDAMKKGICSNRRGEDK